MIEQLAGLPRKTRLLITILVDIFISIFAVWLALTLRFEELVALNSQWMYLSAIAPILTIPIFVRVGLYRSLIRHFSLHVVWVIIVATMLSMMMWGLIAWQLEQPYFPRSVALIAWLVLFVLTFFTRFVMHALFMIHRKEEATNKVAIYGTDSRSIQMAPMLEHDPHYTLVGFISDDSNVFGKQIEGVKVHRATAIETLIEKDGLEYILLSRSNNAQFKKRLEFLADYPVKLRAIESLSDAVSAPPSLKQLEDIGIEELLGRSEVEPNRQLLKQGAHGRCVMMTGAGGSIGSQLCRHILALRPRKLLLLEQSEHALFTIYQELLEYCEAHSIELATVVTLLGSVEDAAFVREAMQKYKVDIVYHAAAYKHVSLVENNSLAGIRNNILGTKVVATAAGEQGVKHFVLISTDKAVEPANVMGASKNAAEKIIQTLATRHLKTCFCAVRFGNVLGSSGSVVPIFRDQISRGVSLTVTDPLVERYFMSISEATELVVQAGAMANSGDIFLLDMGDPIKIDEVAKKMIHLSGLSLKDDNNPTGDIAIDYIGLRPGEKLYEKLYLGDTPSVTQHPKIMWVTEPVPDYDSFMELIDQIETAIKERQSETAIRLLSKVLTT